MKSIPVATRLDPELHATFTAEMKRRGQDQSQLLRTFVRDGLARYDSYSEQIMQTQLAILEHLKKLQELIGGVMHVNVEQSVLGMRQNPEESPEAYKERLTAAYRKMVFEALGKGARIAAVSTIKDGGPRVAHDR